MKQIALILVLVFLPFSLFAQTVIKKDPGAPITIDWTYPTTADLTGFRIYVAPSRTSAFTFSGTSTPSTARTVTFPATFATNSVRLLFKVVAYKTGGTETVESIGTPGDKEVELNVVSPTAVQVK